MPARFAARVIETCLSALLFIAGCKSNLRAPCTRSEIGFIVTVKNTSSSLPPSFSTLATSNFLLSTRARARALARPPLPPRDLTRGTSLLERALPTTTISGRTIFPPLFLLSDEISYAVVVVITRSTTVVSFVPVSSDVDNCALSAAYPVRSLILALYARARRR